jgi:mono/diheme cytochrome c family protein
MTMFAKSLKIFLAAGLLLTAVQVAAENNVDSGKALYQKLCAACHSATPAKLMGQPADSLVAGMEKVRDMSNASGAAAKMQSVLKPLTQEQIKDIATYLNQLK